MCHLNTLTKFSIICIPKTKKLFRVRFPRYITGKVVHTKYINFPGYIPNLTSVKDNLNIYNKLMFFKTLPKQTRKNSIFVRCQFSGIRPVLQHLADASCFKFRPHT
jgi:hypothetical protein